MKVAGARGITRSRVPLIAMLALAATIGVAGAGLTGCSGDDGKNGDPGAPGQTGPVGPTGPTGPTGPVVGLEKPLESCAVCHDSDSVYSVDTYHATAPDVAVSITDVSDNGATVQVVFNAKLDGTNETGFNAITTRTSNGVTTPTAYRYDGDLRNQLALADLTFSGGQNGNYSILINNAAAYVAVPSRYLIRIQNDDGVRAMVEFDYPRSPDDSLVSSAGCSGCHGNDGQGGAHYSYPMSGANCTVCHDASNTTYPRLVNIGHSIHNSELMPDGEYQLTDTNGGPVEDPYKVSFPSYMTNCSICHAGGALPKANGMRVTAENCFSCHGSMESWDWSVATGNGLTFHEELGDDPNCQNCHSDGNVAQALQYVFQMHNGLETERVGIIWNGEDMSVKEGKKFTWDITGVTDNGTNLVITWVATYDGASVNPCNTTVAAGAPGFAPYGPNPANEGTLSFLRSYAQGDDFVLGQSTSAPGQANAVNLTTTNTVCAGNVATTTIPVDAGVTAGMRGRLALQGKPTVPVPADFANSLHAAEWPYTTMYARVPTPTREFIVGTGAEPTDTRRAIVDTDRCLVCHVGSLYQHGNNRVDNADVCVMCHNSASSDQNNRVTMGVDASEAYDGKVGQTYELKSFLHAVHSAGDDTHGVLAIYRTRGIYAWTPEGVTPPNWATTPCEKATPTPGQEYLVYGADPAQDVSCQPFSLYHPTYPRPVNDCYMCHTDDFAVMPDQTQAMATTLDAGVAPWNNQLDDVLQGATSAACTSCHQSSAAKGHANQNGWTPTTFEDGRQTIIDAAQ